MEKANKVRSLETDGALSIGGRLGLWKEEHLPIKQVTETQVGLQSWLEEVERLSVHWFQFS